MKVTAEVRVEVPTRREDGMVSAVPNLGPSKSCTGCGSHHQRHHSNHREQQKYAPHKRDLLPVATLCRLRVTPTMLKYDGGRRARTWAMWALFGAKWPLPHRAR